MCTHIDFLKHNLLIGVGIPILIMGGAVPWADDPRLYKDRERAEQKYGFSHGSLPTLDSCFWLWLP